MTLEFLSETEQGSCELTPQLPRECLMVVGRGSWVQSRGSWVQSRGSWVVGRGSWVVGTKSWVPSRGLLIINNDY